VVDDEPEIVSKIQQMLVRLGYRVVGVSRPADALVALSEAPGDFHLLITDFTMPEMTGLELARAAARLAPHLRILLCTAYHEPLTAEVLQRAHILGTVHKPFRYTTLARHVRQVLDH
jgi:DNA-binding NtrC family response regulator